MIDIKIDHMYGLRVIMKRFTTVWVSRKSSGQKLSHSTCRNIMKSLKITAGGEKGLPSGPTLKKPVHCLMGMSSRLNRVSWDIIIFWIRRSESVRQPWQKNTELLHSVTGTTGLETAGCCWRNRFSRSLSPESPDSLSVWVGQMNRGREFGTGHRTRC